jgi:hypothetical protein
MARRSAVLIVFAMICAVLGAGAADAQSTRAQRGRVIGTVVDAGTGAPVARAVVSTDGGRQRVLSDSAGRFVLRAERGMGSALVQRIGYDQGVVSWDLQADAVAVTASLNAGAIMLAELTVKLDRLDVAFETSPLSVRRIDDVQLALSTAIEDRFPRRPMACIGVNLTSSENCSAERDCVIIDDAPLPSGTDGLRLYRPADLGRLYLARGGRVIIGYSRAYLEWLPEAASRKPLSIMTLTRMYCA